MEQLNEQRATTLFHYYFKSQWRGRKTAANVKKTLVFFFFFSKFRVSEKDQTNPVCGSVQKNDRKYALNDVRSFPC